jgi:hypothetical protein
MYQLLEQGGLKELITTQTTTFHLGVATNLANWDLGFARTEMQ